MTNNNSENLSDDEILNTFVSTKNLDIKLDIISATKSPSMFRKLYKNSDDLLLKREIIQACQDDVVYTMALREREQPLKIAVIRSIYNNLKNVGDEITKPKVVAQAQTQQTQQTQQPQKSQQIHSEIKKPQRKYLSNSPQMPQKTQNPQIAIRDFELKKRTIADLDKF
jgi:DNA-binding protein Fis